MQIDTSTPFGQRVERRLREETIVWLTTVRADGTPEPSPVWFWWDGSTVLIYSRPNTPKLRHIAANQKVSLNFDGDGGGGDIVVMTGVAETAPDAPPSNRHAEYGRKYAERIRGIGMTADSFAGAYSVAIRVVPTRLRGH
jgi:PPOX class probable F420-dependent enzyme